MGGKLTLNNSKSASSTQYGLNVCSSTGCGGTISITSSTFSNNPNYGIFESGYTGSLTLTTSSLANNGTAAAYIGLNGGVNFIPSGNTATGTTAGFVMYGAATSTTWYKDLPYLVDSVSVNPGNTLTVNHGAVVKFINTKYFDIQGALSVNGTTTDPVYFTSNNDPTGSDTNGTSTTAAAAGDWNKIQIDAGASTTISNAIVRYGGGNSGSTDIYQSGGTLNISGSTISSSTSYGIYTIGGTLNVTTSTVSNNGSYGIYESGSSGSISITDNNFANNATISSAGAAFVDLGSGAQFNPLNNVATGTGWRGFVLSGSLAANTTLQKGADTYLIYNTPYIIQTSLVVSSGTTLTINPGVPIKLFTGAYIDVPANGTLSVQGASSTSPGSVFITSMTDDSVYGDTNADTTSTFPQPGDGGYIEVDAGASGTMSGTDIKYGGGTFPVYSNIYQTGGTLTLNDVANVSSSNYGFHLTGGTCTANNSQFLDSPYGVYMTAGTITLASSVFSNNTSDGIYNGSGVTSTAVATRDYWGSDQGPYNAASHSTGTLSEPVSDYVSFIPWVTSSTGIHYVEAVFSVSGTQLKYYASTTYITQWNVAVNTWQAQKSVGIASTTASSTAYLQVSDVNGSDLPWAAATTFATTSIPGFQTSTIQFNQYYLNYEPNAFIQNSATHELGHALGLDHSYYTNIMFYTLTGQTTLGSQDLNDYHYLWH